MGKKALLYFYLAIVCISDLDYYQKYFGLRHKIVVLKLN